MASPGPTNPRTRLAAWSRRHRPAIALVVLAVVIPEVLTGSTPVPNLLNPIALAGLLGFYGAGALLIRELARRWGQGWVGVLGLGLAYGVAEEGIATKTVVDPRSSAAGFLGSYGHYVGVNWVFGATIVLYHAVFSIALPILLVQLLYPKRRDEAFLSVRGTEYAAGVLALSVGVGYLGFDPRYFEGYAVLAGLLGAIALFVAAARWLPARWLRAPTERPTAGPRRFLGLGLSFSFGWAFLYLIAPHFEPVPSLIVLGEIALSLAVLGAGVAWGGRASHGRHAGYLAIGLLAWYVPWSAVIVLALGDYLEPVFLAAVLWVTWVAIQRGTEADPASSSDPGPGSPPAQIATRLDEAMVNIGDAAPDFDAPTQSGTPLKLSTLRGGPVVLYFYPAADTSGCTIESKAFRDLMPELDRQGVKVVGISTDDVPAQAHFAQKCSLPFPLVADSSKTITTAYGVLGHTGRARRVTFFLDAKGTVVDTVDASQPLAHVDRARERFLKA